MIDRKFRTYERLVGIVEKWQTFYLDYGNNDFEVMNIQNLNHLMQTSLTGEVSEYENIPETMSPAAMKVISDWIRVHIR